MVHIYCGEGKGKTTAAVGLAVRAAGRGMSVVIAQFLKGADSGERIALESMEGITLLPVPEKVKFSFRMNEEERREASQRFEGLCAACEERIRTGQAQLVVLDEACAAVSTGLLKEERLLSVLDAVRETETEVVVTGRDPFPALLERGDYITEMKPLRHPFQKGIRARRGIEY